MIKVVIPPQGLCLAAIYCNSRDCYLARELRILGYKDIFVTDFGKSLIDGKLYRPKNSYSYDILSNNFRNGNETIVELEELTEK